MVDQSIPISKTKIIIPSRRKELFSRTRLLDRLTALLDNKLLLLSAPAGYGKTSLLIDLANHVEMPVCWLSLDQLDRDPQRFIAYLIASLAERFPKIGETSRQQLNQLKSIEQDAEALLIMLTNEIYDYVEDDFLFIIDDFHLLDDIPVISSLLNRFLELAVENCHVLLSSRTLPSLVDVTLMVAREQVAGLNHVDLAFLPHEIQALYTQNYRRHLSDEDARKIIEETDGWITGLVLSNSPETTRVSGVNAFAYLGKQVLDQQPEHIRKFLMRTSMPEEFNASFCEDILSPLHTEPQNWYDLMSFILEKNLFVLPLGSDGRWLRYHPLFREFLQSRLKDECPQEVQTILERMVTYYEEMGEWEKAYFTCQQLDDPYALADVIERAGTPMLQSALVTLESWVNSLPPAIVQTRPGLISLRGPILAMKGNFQESKEFLDKAISIYRKKQDIEELIRTLIRRANTLRFLGDYTASLEDIQEALHLSETDVSYQSHYAEALRLRGLTLYRLGESRQAVESLEHSLSLFMALKEAARIPTLLMETGMVHGAVGDVEAARRSYQEALKIRQAEKNLYSQAEILNNLGVLYHQTGEYEFASEAFKYGSLCARKSRNYRAESLILTGLGDLYGEVDEFDAALHVYRQAESAAANISVPFITNYLIIAMGNLALRRGDLNDMSQTLKAYQKKMRATQSAYDRGLWMLLEGKYYLIMNELQEAVDSLTKGKEVFSQDGRELELQWCKVWLAAVHAQAGDMEKARTEIQSFFPAGAVPNHALLVTLRHASPWLKKLQSDSIVGRQLSSLIERSHRLNVQLPAIRRTLRRHSGSIQVPSASMMIQAFGHPEVSVNGRVVAMSEWRTQSVRDLFFYFLHRQDAVTKEQAGAVLWPEAPDAQTLKARFKNDIYRLRRAVGRDAIVFEDEYYRFNREVDYEYDVEAFDSHLDLARKTTDTEARIDHLQKAVDLVHGPYLADVDADWVAPERERLGLAYSSSLEELGNLYLNVNRLKNCLSICQLALNKDRFHEVIYQIEMQAYGALGDRSAVAKRYQACKAAMQELGIPPSEETERIYRDLTS